MKKYQKHIFIMLFFSISFLSYGQRDCVLISKTYFSESSIILRSNLASWLILTPSLGVEYKTSDRIGLILDASMIQLDLENSIYKYWRMWNLSPQLRYYLGRDLNNYVGLQYMLGSYNVSGKQGDYMGGGITAGHHFYISKKLLFDLGFSLGYLSLYNTEKFERIEGVDYLVGEKYSKAYIGPIGVSMSLVWKIN